MDGSEIGIFDFRSELQKTHKRRNSKGNLCVIVSHRGGPLTALWSKGGEKLRIYATLIREKWIAGRKYDSCGVQEGWRMVSNLQRSIQDHHGTGRDKIWRS